MKTWNRQLEDKSQCAAIQLFWVSRNCKKNPEQLQRTLLNIVEHYKNIHDNCPSLSRYKTDSNYEPSKKVITDHIAENFRLMQSNNVKCTNIHITFIWKKIPPMLNHLTTI